MKPLVSKFITREDANKIRADLKAQGNTVGFTSGVFDLLHPGHIDYLTNAKSKCDILIVGLNSDASVKAIKGHMPGPSRPVCDENARAKVLSALEVVDFVFIFSEANNNKNIELLKPDFYIKAEEYKDKLSSAQIVESYGGKVILVPHLKAYSTSKLIENICGQAQTAACIDLPPKQVKPAIFVDRDGTINEEIEYLHEPEKLRIFAGALEALKRLRDAGFYVIMVTNQPGIGLGYFTKEDFFKVTKAILKEATKVGLSFDRIYFCPHNKSEGCTCRKPGTALIERAVKELTVDLTRSFVIGDMTSDMMLGKNSGLKTVLVKTGAGGKDGLYEVKSDFVADNLNKAADWILTASKS